MKSLAIPLLAIGVLSASTAVRANPDLAKAPELAKASGCLSCHAIDEKIVGPAFQSVAEKYAGQADAAAGLVQSIQNGSRGKWGRAAMPPHGSMSAEELNTLAHWVLSLKK